MGSQDRGGREEARSAIISSLPHRFQSIFPNTVVRAPALFLNLKFFRFSRPLNHVSSSCKMPIGFKKGVLTNQKYALLFNDSFAL